MMDYKILAVIVIIISATQGQLFEDRRCRCICPSPSSLLNSTQSDRKVFTSNVPANKCNCEEVIVPKIGQELKGHEQEFCLRCECKYETRNTTIILIQDNEAAINGSNAVEVSSSKSIKLPRRRRRSRPPTCTGPIALPIPGVSVQRMRIINKKIMCAYYASIDSETNFTAYRDQLMRRFRELEPALDLSFKQLQSQVDEIKRCKTSNEDEQEKSLDENSRAHTSCDIHTIPHPMSSAAAQIKLMFPFDGGGLSLPKTNVVVIITLWMLTLLFGYMGFLLCLDPLINKNNTRTYEETESGSEEAQTLLMQEEEPED